MIILDTNVLLELMRPKPSARVWHGLRNNRRQKSARPRSPRQKSFMELSCSARASAVRGCWPLRKRCLPRIWEAASSVSRAIQRKPFPRSPLTAVRSAGPSVTPMHRSRPLPKCEGRSLRCATLPTSKTAVSMSLTRGMVREEKCFLGPLCGGSGRVGAGYVAGHECPVRP